MKNRHLYGLAMAGVAGLVELGYVRYLISQADRGVKTITIENVLIYGPISLICVGLYYMVWGDRLESLFKMDPSNITVTDILFLLPAPLLAVGCSIWVTDLLHQYGYK
jgi:hypothetical protein